MVGIEELSHNEAMKSAAEKRDLGRANSAPFMAALCANDCKE
jgi:hypothetical protein